MAEQDLRFNDFRGTAATEFYFAGFSIREIAATRSWKEESVEGSSDATSDELPRSKRGPENLRPENEQIPENRKQTVGGILAKHWSGRRESNPRMQLGKLPFYH